MEKIELGTPDLTAENIEKLLELFPQVATEVEDNAPDRPTDRPTDRAA